MSNLQNKLASVIRFKVLITLFLSLIGVNCYAANQVVSNTSNSGAGSLRQAVTDVGDGEEITFSTTGTITLSSQIAISGKSITITGPGSGSLSISGNDAVRVFSIASGAGLIIKDVTITNGNVTGYGGAIDCSGTLDIRQCVVQNSQSSSEGGGIYCGSGSTLLMYDCTVSGNTATANGGGITVSNTNTTIKNSTIKSNTASGSRVGGGLFIENSNPVLIENSTITANIAQYGGACEVNSFGNTATFLNCTIVGNNITTATGGFNISNGTVLLKNTICAGNAGATDPDYYLNGGSISSGGYNIIGNRGTQSFTSTTGDQVGTSGSPIDPLLNSLASNGGYTQTMSTQASSTARDAIPSTGSYNGAPTYDQRGYVRSGDRDIGAYENDASPPAPEMNVTGNSVSIADGDNSPTTADHTGFGSVLIHDGSVVRTFTIENTGGGDLTLSGTPKVDVSGHTSDFSVTSQPTSPVSGSGSVTFQVTFNPTTSGLRSASLSIANDDSDENPYNFDIEGTGTTAPEMSIEGNSVVIADGDASPTTSDHTDFGDVDVISGSIVRTFTIKNIGSADLTMGGSPIVTVSGHTSDFSVTSQPTTPVSASGSVTFQVTFNPTTSATRNATLSIDNNDSDENPYNFSITGNGTYSTPTTQASNVSFTNVGPACMDISWTNGNGADRAVFLKEASSGTASPVDGTTYTANALFGAGTQIGSTGWYCIYNGSGTSVSITGVTPAATYRVMVCEYNGTSGYEKYFTNTATNNPANQTAASIMINEVDADQTGGTDLGEFVELFDGGSGSKKLDGLVVVFYDGTTDQTYAAYDLDASTTDGSGYFVLGNTGVTGVDKVFADNTLQNGADAVALFVGSSTDFPNGTALTSTNLVDAIVYDINVADDAGLIGTLTSGQAQINEDGRSSSATHSNQRIPNGSGGLKNTTAYTQQPATPGAENYAYPEITSATYDYSTNVLTVTGKYFVANSGVSNDVDISQLTITGEGGQTYTLTGANNVEISSSTSFAVTLSGSDLPNVEALLNKNGTTSADGSTYYVSAADDWLTGAPGGNVITDNNNAVTVSNFANPVITSLGYDASTGVLSATGTNFVVTSGANNDVDVSLLTITGEGSGTYTLTSTDVELSSATSFSLTLNSTDKVMVNGLLNKNGTTSDDGTLYNLALADNWMAGSPAANNIADATNALTTSNVTSPVVSSVTYDASTSTLVVTGTNFVKKSGTTNDVDVSKLTLTGEGAGTYTLSSSNVEITSETTFSVVLNTTDQLSVNGLLNKNGTSSDDATTYNLAAADNWMSGAATSVDISDLTGNGVTVSNVSNPAITSATYNAAIGTLVVTGTNFVSQIGASNDVLVSSVTLTGESGNSYTLTSTNVEITSGTSFSINLNSADKLNCNGLLNKNGTTSGDGNTYNLAAADNWMSGAATSVDISDLTGNGITVSNVANPIITSATLDISTGILIVTGTNLAKEPGVTNDIAVSSFTLTGEGGATRTLTTPSVEVTSSTSFSVTLNASDLDAVRGICNKNGTVSTSGTTYNLAAADNWMSAADAAIDIADLTGNGVTVSNVVVPSITSATYDIATGTFVVTGSGITSKGSGADIDASTFTITGEGSGTYTLSSSSDVERDSYTQFTIVLSSTDKTAIDVLLNKSGTSSNDATTYNLAAGEDWALGTAAAVNCADLTGNSITVLAFVAPTVTTQSVSNITATTAVGNGNVTDLGSPHPTEHGVCWSTTTAPTTSDSKTTEGTLSTTGAFTSSMSGLTAGTLYYVRAYATNSAGTSYGSEVSFTTHSYPTSANKTVSISEDTDIGFTVSDFGFTDADAGDTLYRVMITTLESAGELYLDADNDGLVDGGEAVTLNQEIVKADIPKLKLKPADNANGVSYATWGFKLSDSLYWSSSAYTMSINVNAVNDTPTIATAITDTTVTEDFTSPIQYRDLNTIFTDVENGSALTFSVASLQGKVTPSVNGVDSVLVLTAVANAAGVDTVVVTASDGSLEVKDSVEVTVTAVNDAPTISSATAQTVAEDGSLTILLSMTDGADVDNTLTDASIVVEAGTNYTVSGTTITPTQDFVGTLTVPVKVTDGTLTSSAVNMSVTVTAVNDAPTITTATAQTIAEDASLPVILSMTDGADVDNSLTDASIVVEAGSNYTVSGTTITPVANYVGALTVPVKVTDGTLTSSAVNMSVTVTAVNDAPTISSATAQIIAEDASLTVLLSMTDGADVDNTLTDASIVVEAGSNYTVSGTTITPFQDYVGTLTVPVKVTDGTLTSSAVNMSVTVTAVNDVPTITSATSQTIAEDGSLTILLSMTDGADVDNTLTDANIVVEAGSNYTVSGTTISPTANFNGTLTVPVKVTDGTLTSPAVNMSVTVAPVNDAPTLTSATAQTVAEDTPLVLTLAMTDGADIDGDALTLIVEAGDNYTVDGTTITPLANYNGALIVPVKVTDGTLTSSAVNMSVTVTAVNDAPTISSATAQTITEDGSLIVLLSMTDGADVDNTLTDASIVVEAGSNYTVSGTTITPIANYVGALTVPVKVTDGTLTSAAVNMSVTVTAANDAPTITTATAQTIAEDASLIVLLSMTDGTDVDNTLTDASIIVEAGDNYTVDGTTITPVANYNGALIVPVKVTDGVLTSAAVSMSVTVTPVNDAPTVTSATAQTIIEDSTLVLTLAMVEGEADVDGDALTITALAGTNYTVSGSSITPTLGFVGLLDVSVVVTDGTVQSSPVVMKVTVLSGNAAPVLESVSPFVMEQDVPKTFSIEDVTASDEDGDDLTLLILTGANYTVTNTTITPLAGFTGTLSIPFMVTDGKDSSNTITKEVVVKAVGVNNKPEIDSLKITPIEKNSSLTVTEEMIVAFDADGDELSMILGTGENYTVKGKVITPTPEFTGILLVPVSVTDGVDTSEIDTARVHVFEKIIDFHKGQIQLSETFKVEVAPNPAQRGSDVRVRSALGGYDQMRVKIYDHVGNLITEGEGKPSIFWSTYTLNLAEFPHISGSFVAYLTYYKDGLLVGHEKRMIGIEK